MKVRSINIPKLHHFKDFYLDLTYPLGHPKAGKPLDKVCIIGQSGTGKTTLLKLISTLSFSHWNHALLADMDTLSKIMLEFELDDWRVIKSIEATERNSDGSTDTWNEAFLKGVKVPFDDVRGVLKNFLDNTQTLSIYFPAELDLKMEVDRDEERLVDKQQVIDFSIEKITDIWKIILEDVQQYQEEEIKIRQAISKIAEHSKDFEAIQEAVKKLDEWKEINFNPLEDVADKCLDPLLKNFGLRVRKELDFHRKDDLGTLKIEDFQGNEVPMKMLSTGTKQVMLSALPLYVLSPDKCQILYDEPEKSLYPDIQRFITDYYINLTTNCQFFFATHSPIIASSFEPWEIVELKFDADWNVYRELYYEGENHVDNYFVDPRYLDFDLILSKVFDLKDTNTDLRTEAIVEATMLKNQLNELKAQDKLKTKEATKIINRYRELAKKLAWNLE